MNSPLQLLLLACLAWVAQAALPLAPPAFSARGSTPYLSYTFRQADCLLQSIPEDVDTLLPLALGTMNVSCPTRLSFANAKVGVAVVGKVENGLKSGFLSNDLTFATQVASSIALTLELFITKRANINAGDALYFVEVGDTTTGVASLADPGNQKFYFRLDSANAAATAFDVGTLGDFGGGTYSGVSHTANFAGNAVAIGLVGELISSGNINSTYFIAATLSVSAGKTFATFYIGKPSTGAFSGPSTPAIAYVGVPNGHNWANTTSVLRVGGTVDVSPAAKGYPAEYHLVQFHPVLSNATLYQHLLAGLPNSNPAVSSTNYWTLREDIATDHINFSLPASTYYDDDGNVPVRFYIKSVPSHGDIYVNSVKVTSPLPSIGQLVLVGDNVTYTQSVANTFSTADSLCVLNVSPFDSFSYVAQDQYCDGVATNGAANCVSPNLGTINLCVLEQNHAPDTVAVQVSAIALTESVKSSAVVLSCKDRDTNTSAYGLKYFRLLNQTRPDLGALQVWNASNSSCSGVDLAVNSSLAVFSVSPTPGTNAVTSLTLCYRANKSALNVTDIGTDVFTFTCTDNFNANSTVGNASVVVRNALLAGCGALEAAESTVCQSTGIQDTSFTIVLKGYDGVAAHVLAKRRFRVDVLPAHGKLYIASDVNLTSPLNVSAVLNASLADGFLNLTYVPNQYYYNAYKANLDPGETGYDIATLLVQNDQLGKPLFGCLSASGCPDTLAYSLGYDELNTGNPVFGPSLAAGAQLWVINVNDPASIAGPTTLPCLADKNARYNQTQLVNVTKIDGDVRRMGFSITSLLNKITFKIPYVDPAWQDVILVGDLALELGTPTITGKAYASDLNAIIHSLSMETTRTSGNDTVIINIWDPISDAGSSTSSFSSIANATANYTAVQCIGLPVSDTAPDSTLGQLIIGGVAAAVFIILVSLLACVCCVKRMAVRGERSAIWIMRNILCSEVDPVQHRTSMDLEGAAAGARKSLQVAIHEEHRRMERVVWCALFMKRVCPCVVKIEHELNLPDEETMMRTALDGEAHRLATKHKPQPEIPEDGPFPAGPRSAPPADRFGNKEDVEEDQVADDTIFDWERHLDEASGRVFYYNAKSQQSSWTPPKVKVHASKDRVSMRREGVDLPPALFQPKPPGEPRPGHLKADSGDMDDEANRMKKT